MGIFSGLRAINKLKKIQAGGKESFSIADITNLIINLSDASRNLSKEEYEAVYALFCALGKCRSNMLLDIKGYYEEAVTIIGIFNQIAPYEKYSGMDKTEALFFMSGIRPILEEIQPKSEELLNHIKKINPKIEQYFLLRKKSVEDLLKQIVDVYNTKEAAEYINYLFDNSQFLKKEHIKAFYGILIVNHLQGKEKALELLDKLFIEWIESETKESLGMPVEEKPQYNIGFFCGVLVPNGVLTNEECDHLRDHYVRLMAQHTESILSKE